MAWYDRILGVEQKNTPRRLVGFNNDGVVMTDGRDTREVKRGGVSEKSETLGDDPLAIYKPTGAKHVDAAKAMGNFTGWTYAAVNAVASEMSNIQWRLYQKKGEDHEELDDHPLLQLLEGVNEDMTGIELKYVMASHLELTGNFYGLLLDVKDAKGQPTAIYPLNPGRVKVKLDKSKFPYRIDKYQFTIDGKIFTYEKHEILHIRYPDPGDPYLGIGFPQTIPVWIDSDNYAMEYNRKYFLNGAGIGLYIATQTNVEGQIDRIRRQFSDKYAGTENAHKVPVMPKGVDLKNAGTTHKDMDFPHLADNTRDRILAAARVSKTILGTAESDTNRATAETADYVFSKRTIKPKMLLIVSFLNEFLTPRYGDDLYLTFIDPVPEDKAARTTEMQAAVGSAPVITQNEARKNFMGLGPIEGGDVLMRPSTMEAVGTSDEVDGENVAPALARAMTPEGWRTNAVRVRHGKSQYSASHAFRESLRAAFESKITAEREHKNIKDLTHAEYMEHWKRFNARTLHAEQDLRRVFHGINVRQREEVIANLSDATGIKKTVGELFNVAEWMGITIDLATPILTSLTKDEAAAALAMIGAQHQDILANANVQASLDAGIANMAKSYNQTTLDQLTKTIGDKLASPTGTNLNELTNAVNDVYSFADERRAGLIAKTESFRASNQANLNAWNQSGVVKTIKWYTAEDGNVCKMCDGLDGTIVDITTDFFKADYGEGTAPPAHPDCRCYIRPEDIST